MGVTCHLHFWQNDRGLLRSTAVTRGVERTPNKSQHTKLTLEKKIFPPLLLGLELATFRSRVRRSNQHAIPSPSMPSAILSYPHINSISSEHASSQLEVGAMWRLRYIICLLLTSLACSCWLFAVGCFPMVVGRGLLAFGWLCCV